MPLNALKAMSLHEDSIHAHKMLLWFCLFSRYNSCEMLSPVDQLAAPVRAWAFLVREVSETEPIQLVRSFDASQTPKSPQMGDLRVTHGIIC